MKLTQKQERFTRNLFEGLSQREAYIKAGYSSNSSPETIDKHACQLANSAKILSRYIALQKKADVDVVASYDERLKILSEIGRGRLADFVDDAGVIDKRKLTSRAIQAVDQQLVRGKIATVTKLRLHNPIQAIAELNKMDGSYAPEKSINLNLEAKDLTDEELLSIINERSGRGILPAETSP